MAIDLTKDSIYIDGVSSVAIADGLANTGMTSSQIVNLLGHMFVGYVGGKGRPAFRFTTTVRDTDPRCEATFDPDFEHIDWADGVNRVQAGMTPEELGFNARFHAIEADFSAAADQFTALSACIRALRADLVGIVTELETKITDLDRQITQLKAGSDSGSGGGGVIRPGAWEYLGNATIADKQVVVARLGEQIVMTEVLPEMIQEGSIIGRGGLRPGDLRDGGLVGGAGGVVLGPDRDVVVPRDGLVVTRDRVRTVSGRPLELTDLLRFGEVVEDRVVAGRDATGTATRTVDEVRAGADDLVRTVTEGLPGSDTVADAELLNVVTERAVAALAEQERDDLRTRVLTADAAARRAGPLLASSVAGLSQVSAEEAAILSDAGFGRIGSLASATSPQVLAAVAAAGGEIEESRVRAAVAAARVARAVRSP